VGLFLYSGQLAIDTMVGVPSGKETQSKIIQQRGTKEDQSSNNSL